MKAIELKPTDLMAVVIEETTDLDTAVIKLEDGKPFIKLGTCTADHIDFDVEPFVDCGSKPMGMYKNYTHESPYSQHQCKSAEESFSSLLSSNGLYFEPPQYCGCSGPCGIPCTYADWDENGRNIVQKLLIIKPLK